MALYVIQNVSDGSFWSNELGWVSIESADRFTDEERQVVQHLPLESKWVTLWDVDSVQFARLIAECEAAGVFCDNERMQEVAESMDVDLDDVFEIVERAQKAFDDYKAASLGKVIMTLEQVAESVGDNRKQLRNRLMEAKAVLTDEVRKGFGKGKFDFDLKQLVGENGYVLQWRVREFPDRPVSYQNQQTSRGCVVCLLPAE